ncbi:MAG: glycosyltransferase family 2 protein [Methanospirillum sp.]|uniref:dolichyl-phosphate beta-glucosyltransferase n=1 Tax=Methanospirillum sp. TaxID=45200 RepID=UPI00236F56C0|nr:dolichyl-phosphate beta-glucosyltransferase [Methanospirillum sp.]MDD1729149.1 glycosyltransferase family 2 protein [Methanospirillum sp.]
MNTNSKSFISVVIPVYNDISALKKAIPQTLQLMEQNYSGFEIIIAEDASTDGSAECAASWQERDSRIVHLHRDQRLGRGSALSTAAMRAKGDIFCYFDVDLATDMAYLPQIINVVDEGADIATGSRLLSDSDITRSLNREIKSRGYNWLVRFILRSRLNDHQCGFKAFRRNKLLALLPEICDTHWFWDTEVLVRAQRKGFQIAEIPVLWREGPGTTVKSQDIWKMGRSILNLWWRIHVS